MKGEAFNLIGPNAILQLWPVLNVQLGAERARALLDQAGLHTLPDGHAMIPETDAASLHRAVRHSAPDEASIILREAGIRTADYILAHRIPKPAQILLKILPTPIAAWLLSRAITQHAWTFVGSGQFRRVTSWQFEIEHNPLIAGEQAETCLCGWHAAVFERLYCALISPHARCEETICGAQTHEDVCCFVLII